MVAAAPPNDRVSTIMSTKVVTVKATDKVRVALTSMVRNKIGSIIVVDRAKPVGILTERDISTRIAKGQNVRGMVIKNVMSKPLVTVAPSVQVWEAVELMVRKDLRRLPVIENDKLVGMVTERDIIHWLVRVAYEPNIPEDVRRLLDTRIQAHALAH